METTQMSTTGKMDKQIVLVIKNEYHSAMKQTNSDVCNYMEESQKCYVEWKKPFTKEYLLNDSIDMKSKDRQN